MLYNFGNFRAYICAIFYKCFLFTYHVSFFFCLCADQRSSAEGAHQGAVCIPGAVVHPLVPPPRLAVEAAAGVPAGPPADRNVQFGQVTCGLYLCMVYVVYFRTFIVYSVGVPLCCCSTPSQ